MPISVLNMMRYERVVLNKRDRAIFEGIRKALEKLPTRKLITGRYSDGEGGVCTLGAYMKQIDKFATPYVRFNIVRANDTIFGNCTEAERYTKMLEWLNYQLG